MPGSRAFSVCRLKWLAPFREGSSTLWRAVGVTGLALLFLANGAAAQMLRAGFGKVDITPQLRAGAPVWIAGYGQGREAQGVHDPLFCRCWVLEDGTARIALASVDLIGLQYPEVERIRGELPGFDYVLVASTHQHEGPDVIGIWGPTPIQSGVDPAYLDQVVQSVVKTVRLAQGSMESIASVEYGTARATSLLRDARLPYALDDVLRTLRFIREDGSTAGILVQFSNHPESLGSQNRLITADFPYATIASLEARYHSPVSYLTGAIGGLMTNPPTFTSADGTVYKDGTFDFAEAYGRAVADVAITAIEHAHNVQLTPIRAASRKITVPLENPHYILARSLGVIQRKAFAWTGYADDAVPLSAKPEGIRQLAVLTEAAVLRLGEVEVACIPGEIYPELIYGSYQDPAEPNADFPDAPLEPHLTSFLREDRLLIVGLANDELGYIIPRRQWDQFPPYAYGRSKSQYGEINSCGPGVAPILMKALHRLAGAVSSP